MSETEPRDSKTPEATDEALAASAARGDHAALRALHRRYAGWVFRIARRSLGEAAAEEIVQDTFVQVWRRGETFDPTRGSFRAWLGAVTRARVLNEVRRRSRRPQLADDERAAESAPDESALPDESAWREYRAAALHAAVDALPAHQRRALALAFFDDLPHEQVAAALDVPLGTAKTRIRAGLRRLHLALAPALVCALIAAVVLARRGERTERALVAVTSSDLLTRRLVAPAGSPWRTAGADPQREPHATYRARPGDALAVITYSHLPRLEGGGVYVAWARRGAGWTRLGAARPDAAGHALFVAEPPGDAAGAPDGLSVTREPDDAVTPAPRGPVVLQWPAAEGSIHPSG